MVKMIPLVCPHCGANLEIKEGTQTCFCSYCGTKLLVNDPNTKTINKNINITKVTRDETEIRKKEIETDQKHKYVAYALLILVIIIELVFMYGIMSLTH